MKLVNLLKTVCGNALDSHFDFLDFLQTFKSDRHCHQETFHQHGPELIKSSPLNIFKQFQRHKNIQSEHHCKDKTWFVCVCLLQDLKDSVSRITQFLEIRLDNEVIEKIVDQCLFKNMKTNNSNFCVVSPEMTDLSKSEFMRKGEFQQMIHTVYCVI